MHNAKRWGIAIATSVLCTAFMDNQITAHGTERPSGWDVIMMLGAIAVDVSAFLYLATSVSRAYPTVFFGGYAGEVIDKTKAFIEVPLVRRMVISFRASFVYVLLAALIFLFGRVILAVVGVFFE